MLNNKVVLITGGTGSFGNAVLNRFLDTDIGEIRIFSLDEKKQEDMRIKYKNDKIKLISLIGIFSIMFSFYFLL